MIRRMIVIIVVSLVLVGILDGGTLHAAPISDLQNIMERLVFTEQTQIEQQKDEWMARLKETRNLSTPDERPVIDRIMRLVSSLSLKTSDYTYVYKEIFGIAEDLYKVSQGDKEVGFKSADIMATALQMMPQEVSGNYLKAFTQFANELTGKYADDPRSYQLRLRGLTLNNGDEGEIYNAALKCLQYKKDDVLCSKHYSASKDYFESPRCLGADLKDGFGIYAYSAILSQEIPVKAVYKYGTGYLSSAPLIGRDDIVDVVAGKNSGVLSVNFNKNGAKKLDALTRQYLNKKLPIAIGSEILTMPMVMEPVSSGKVVISQSAVPLEKICSKSFVKGVPK